MENYYFIHNKKTSECYNKWFKDTSEARNWIINHLDLSLEWIIDIK